MDEASAAAKEMYMEKVRIQGVGVQADLNLTITGIYNRPEVPPLLADLFEDQDQPKLCLKLTKYPEVVPVAEAFDIVYDAHLKCKHGDIQLTHDYLSKKFIVPRACVQWVIESCSFCNPRVDAVPSVSGIGEWRISLIQPYEDIHILDPGRRTVLIFKDDKSNFLQLRSIKRPISQEHLEETLTKLFNEFGYPEKVYVGEDYELFEQCFIELFRSNNGRMPRVAAELSTSSIFEHDKVEVLQELAQWANEAPEPILDVGCYVVQFKMNTTRKCISSIRLRDEFFGVPVNHFYLTSEM